jgi:C-terminal processing protease CtpA/Prc
VPSLDNLAARRVFLTGGTAVSAAETVMGIVENYKLAEIVGSHTAGINGNINYNDLAAFA